MEGGRAPPLGALRRPGKDTAGQRRAVGGGGQASRVALTADRHAQRGEMGGGRRRIWQEGYHRDSALAGQAGSSGQAGPACIHGSAAGRGGGSRREVGGSRSKQHMSRGPRQGEDGRGVSPAPCWPRCAATWHISSASSAGRHRLGAAGRRRRRWCVRLNMHLGGSCRRLAAFRGHAAVGGGLAAAVPVWLGWLGGRLVLLVAVLRLVVRLVLWLVGGCGGQGGYG